MTGNILFTRLQQLAMHAKKFRGHSFCLKNNQSGEPYYIIQLPVDDRFRIALSDGSSLKIRDSHISIHRQVQEQYGKSVWHHSFYLILEGNKRKEGASSDAVVRVFYNADDTLEPTRHAAWQTAAAPFELTDEQWHDFIAITSIASRPIIQALRTEIAEHTAYLLKQYNKSAREAELASAAWKQNDEGRIAYQSALRAAIELLKQYIPIN